MKIIIEVLLLGVLLAGQGYSADRILDKDYKVQGYLKDSRILDKDYKVQGYIRNGVVYDREWRRVGKIEPDKKK